MRGRPGAEASLAVRSTGDGHRERELAARPPQAHVDRGSRIEDRHRGHEVLPCDQSATADREEDVAGEDPCLPGRADALERAHADSADTVVSLDAPRGEPAIDRDSEPAASATATGAAASVTVTGAAASVTVTGASIGTKIGGVTAAAAAAAAAGAEAGEAGAASEGAAGAASAGAAGAGATTAGATIDQVELEGA